MRGLFGLLVNERSPIRCIERVIGGAPLFVLLAMDQRVFPITSVHTLVLPLAFIASLAPHGRVEESAMASRSTRADLVERFKLFLLDLVLLLVVAQIFGFDLTQLAVQVLLTVLVLLLFGHAAV